VVRNYRKDGKPFWNEVVLAPMRDGEGISHFVGLQHDVTERVELAAKVGQCITNLPEQSFLSHAAMQAKRADMISLRVMGWHDGRQAMDFTVNAAAGYPLMCGPEEWDPATAPPAWVPRVALRVDSDQASEDYKWLGMSPVMREWVGGRAAQGGNGSGDKDVFLLKAAPHSQLFPLVSAVVHHRHLRWGSLCFVRVFCCPSNG
jgi:hypothetical protein